MIYLPKTFQNSRKTRLRIFAGACLSAWPDFHGRLWNGRTNSHGGGTLRAASDGARNARFTASQHTNCPGGGGSQGFRLRRRGICSNRWLCGTQTCCTVVRRRRYQPKKQRLGSSFYCFHPELWTKLVPEWTPFFQETQLVVDRSTKLPSIIVFKLITFINYYFLFCDMTFATKRWPVIINWTDFIDFFCPCYFQTLH